MVDVHVGQNVHSYVQMNAAPSGGSAAPHRSQVARISRAIKESAKAAAPGPRQRARRAGRSFSCQDVRLHRGTRQLAVVLLPDDEQGPSGDREYRHDEAES